MFPISVKKVFLAAVFVSISQETFSQNRIQEGIIEGVEVISTQLGRDGKPLLGAAVGVGIGSAFGSGSGKDAAQITGGIIGAARAAKQKKKQLFGWRYIVKIDGALQVVDMWCPKPQDRCSGIEKESEVYVLDKSYVELKN